METSNQAVCLPIPSGSSPQTCQIPYFPITQLPSDILISLLRLISSPKTLSALSLCSKRLHQYAEPYLYSQFNHLGDACTSLSYFLRTILREPRLAQYTKIFTANALLGYCTDIDMSMLTPSDWALLKSSLERVHTLETGERDPSFNPHISSQWLSSIEHGNWDALVAFILCLLPNLQSLNIVNHASGCPNGYPYLETILNRAASLQKQSQHPSSSSHPYSLAKLKHLHLAKHDLVHHPRIGFEILRLLPFLNLPSIRTVSGHMISDFHFPSSIRDEQPPLNPFTLSTIYTPPLPNFTFHTTALTLSHTVLATSTLPKFFSYFTSLKYLSWSWQYDVANARRDGLDYSFDMGVFLNSVLHLSGCLEVLKLRISPACAESTVKCDNWTSTLFSFKALKFLDMSTFLLYGPPKSLISPESEPERSNAQSLGEKKPYRLFFENLPDGLQELVLRDCNMGILEGVFKLFGSRDDVRRPSGLKALEMHFPETKYEGWEEEEKEGKEGKAMGKQTCSEYISQAQSRGVTIRLFGAKGDESNMIQIATSNLQDLSLLGEKEKNEESCEECVQHATRTRLNRMDDWVVYDDSGNGEAEQGNEVADHVALETP
ncbi:hypothetical protein DSL72_009065 [Monilinia vaccinii-corymbosi]|uniref:F-box domain-containing protein n=1 Tax=Monilinia vaccinii-corymbosi TaxID=61207 RepID=A0A8A3PPN2_9HELO|nr:hypothetical protein DSL72_009065 [Monilinia vaccinii-corymbosi]